MALLDLLPGLRDLRGHLAAGYLWLACAWVLLPAVPEEARNGDLATRVESLARVAGHAPVIVAVTFAAYVVGVLAESLSRLALYAVPTAVIGAMLTDGATARALLALIVGALVVAASNGIGPTPRRFRSWAAGGLAAAFLWDLVLVVAGDRTAWAGWVTPLAVLLVVASAVTYVVTVWKTARPQGVDRRAFLTALAVRSLDGLRSALVAATLGTLNLANDPASFSRSLAAGLHLGEGRLEQLVRALAPRDLAELARRLDLPALPPRPDAVDGDQWLSSLWVADLLELRPWLVQPLQDAVSERLLTDDAAREAFVADVLADAGVDLVRDFVLKAEFRLRADHADTLYPEFDRLRGEARYRAMIAAPLGVLSGLVLHALSTPSTRLTVVAGAVILALVVFASTLTQRRTRRRLLETLRFVSAEEPQQATEAALLDAVLQESAAPARVRNALLAWATGTRLVRDDLSASVLQRYLYARIYGPAEKAEQLQVPAADLLAFLGDFAGAVATHRALPAAMALKVHPEVLVAYCATGQEDAALDILRAEGTTDEVAHTFLARQAMYSLQRRTYFGRPTEAVAVAHDRLTHPVDDPVTPDAGQGGSAPD